MMEKLKDALELTYDCLFHPQKTLFLVAMEQRLYEGIWIWMLSVLLTVVSVLAQAERSFLLSLIGIYLGAGIFFLIRIGLLHGAARLLGGRGTIKGLAAALCFADVPLNLATLAESLTFFLPTELVHVISFFSGIWALWLCVITVRQHYQLGAVYSILAIFLPILAVLVCILLLLIYVAVSVVSLFPGW